MSRTPSLEGTSIAWAVADLRAQGASYPLPWASSDTAVGLAERVRTEHAADRREIVRNPHRESSWAWEATCALVEAVQAVIGADVAIENTFLVVGGGGDGAQLGAGDGSPDGGVEVRCAAFLGFDGAEVLHLPSDTAPGVLPEPIDQRREMDRIPRGPPVVIAVRVYRRPVAIKAS